MWAVSNQIFLCAAVAAALCAWQTFSNINGGSMEDYPQAGLYVIGCTILWCQGQNQF